MSLFDDRATEAAARVLARQYGYEHVWENEVGEEVYDREYWDRVGRDALNAALAALPREELVETGRAALERASQVSYSWEDLARAVAVEWGLIPEHVTATEER